MFRLLSLLQSGRRWSTEDLTAAMHLQPRTLRRDIERLKELGYPVDSVRGPGGYYRLSPGKTLPPIMFDDEEAIAAALGLRLVAVGQTGVKIPFDSAGRAEKKLRRLLPTRLRDKTDALLAAIDVEDMRGAQASTEQLATIADAVTRKKTLTFNHEGSRGLMERTVEPVRLIHLDHRWYLYCWDTDRADWRAFRVDRIVGTPQIGLGFAPRTLPAENLVEHLGEQFHGGDRLRIVVDLEATVQRAATRLHRVDGTLDPLPNGGCRYTAFVDSYQWLAMVLLVSDMRFAVVEPSGFRDYVHGVARRFGSASPHQIS